MCPSRQRTVKVWCLPLIVVSTAIDVCFLAMASSQCGDWDAVVLFVHVWPSSYADVYLIFIVHHRMVIDQITIFWTCM